MTSRSVGDDESGLEKRWERLPSRDEGAIKYDEMGRKTSKEGFKKSGWIKSASSQPTEKAGKFGSREQIRIQKTGDGENITIQVIRQGALARAFSSLGLSLGKKVITQINLKTEYPIIDFQGKINIYAVQMQLHKYSTSWEKTDRLIKKLEVNQHEPWKPNHDYLVVKLKQLKVQLSKKDLTTGKIRDFSETLKGYEQEVEKFIQNKNWIPASKKQTERMIKILKTHANDPRNALHNELMGELQQIKLELSDENLPPHKIPILNEKLKKTEEEVRLFISNRNWVPPRYENFDSASEEFENSFGEEYFNNKEIGTYDSTREQIWGKAPKSHTADLRRFSDPGQERLIGERHWSYISQPNPETVLKKFELGERLADVMKSSDDLVDEENRNEIVRKVKFLRDQPNISYEKFKSGIESLEQELKTMLEAQAKISQIEEITEEEVSMENLKRRLDEVEAACKLLDDTKESSELSVKIMQLKIKDSTEGDLDSFENEVKRFENELEKLVEKDFIMQNLASHLNDLRRELEKYPLNNEQHQKLQAHIEGIERAKDLSLEGVQKIIEGSSKFLKELSQLGKRASEIGKNESPIGGIEKKK